MDLLDLFVKIKGDSKPLDDEMRKSEGKAHKFAGKVGGVMKGIGTAAIKGAAVAGGALTTLAGLSLNSYANYEQLVGGVEKLYGSASDKVMQYAQDAYKTVGMSANEYMDTATQFSSALVSSLGGDVEAAADKTQLAMQVISDNANVFGSDMESVSNAIKGFSKENYTMLDNLKLGYAGTKEGAQKLIEDAAKMTDAQKELGVTVDAGSMSFDNMVNAVAVVQQSMGIAGTTSREAAETIEGSTNMMKAAWSNLITGLGDSNADLPLLMNNAVESTITFAKNVLPRLGVIFNSLFELIPQYLGQAYDKYMPLVIEKVPQILSKLLTAISDAAPKVISKVGSLLNKIGSTLVAYAPTMMQKGIQLILKLSQAFAEKAPVIVGKMADIIHKLLVKLRDNLPQIMSAGVKIILNLASGLIKSAPKIVGVMADIGKNMLQGLWNGIESLAGWIWDKISGFFSGTIVGGIKKLLGIHSPSRVFAEIGDYCVKGLEEGMQPINDGSAIKKAIQSTQSGFDVSASVTGKNSAAQLAEALKYADDSRNYTINLVTTLDGKTIATSTARYTQDALNKMQKRSNRLQGVRV